MNIAARLCQSAILIGALSSFPCIAQQPAAAVHLRLNWPADGKVHSTPAVLWLEPQPGTSVTSFTSHGRYTLLQKNRAFVPHLQVVPVGSAVAFPNADPFFHNVFSLFDGKRFDLGLYEAGSTRSVTFSREGVSYIFCNIHPEMSAVVLALATPLYAVATNDGSFTIQGVPMGEYRLHLWVEGLPLSYLDSLGRTVRVDKSQVDLGSVAVTAAPPATHEHTNKFGKPYAPPSSSSYP